MSNNSEKNINKLSLMDSIKLLLSGTPQNHEHIIQLLRNAEKNNILSKEILEMIEGAFQVSKIQVKNIMIPHCHFYWLLHNDCKKYRRAYKSQPPK